jgi:hypothetical protein
MLIHIRQTGPVQHLDLTSWSELLPFDQLDNK